MNNPHQSNLLHQRERRDIWASWLLPLLLLAQPAAVQAQFTYTINNGTVTITGYNGPGGAVTIPDQLPAWPYGGLPVTSIGDGAFAFCTSLTSVRIGTNVTSIGYGPFSQCASLTAIMVDDLNPTFSSVEGVLFNKSQTTLIQCPGGLAGVHAIPNSVTSIAGDAFFGCVNLTEVSIPSSVTDIGGQGFWGCYSLTSVNIPNSVTNLGGLVFYDCTSLASVTIGTNVTSIPYEAFSGCKSLTSVTIPNRVTAIGVQAFAFCPSLTSVAIPNSVTNIGEGAFSYCSSLAAITADALNPDYSSVDGVLFDKSQTTLIQCPEGKTGSYTIPNSVTSIGDGAFENCISLSSVTIPNSVTNIGNWAFFGCNSLTNVAIPNSVISIGGYGFNWCTNLTSISVDGLNSTYSSVDGVLFNKTQTTLVQYPAGTAATSYTIPDSVTSIGKGAFEFGTHLTSVTIPDGVTRIGDGTFEGCTSLVGVYFSGNAPSLGLYVFEYDNNATVYYLPGTTGWGATYGDGLPTALWIEVPTILISPQTQTAEAGSAVSLRVQARSPLPLFYFWYLNATNLLSSGTNWQLELPIVQLSQSGAYTVVISNVLGAVTSAPAMLNVIAAVERRPVPGVKVTGEAASLVNVDCADSLSPAPNWTPLGSVSLTGTSQYCFDLTLPLPPQRFYRAWQTGTLGVIPSLDLHLVPAITLTGSIGHSVRLDYINQFGPIDAWATLDTVTLTNTSQLYFDTSAWRQPQRLYRLVQVP